MQKNLNRTTTENDLNRIFGTDFKVKQWDGGLKVNVPSIDINQMHELTVLYGRDEVQNITAKRSGTGITVLVEVN